MCRLTHFLQVPLQLGHNGLNGWLGCLGHMGHGTLRPLQVGSNYICLQGLEPRISVLNALHHGFTALYGGFGCYVVQLF